MITKSTVLVKRQNKQRRVPLRRIAHRLVNPLDKRLAQINRRRRVEALIRAALGVDVRKLRQRASRRILVKLLQWQDIGLIRARRRRPLVKRRVRVEPQPGARRAVLVVDPADVGFAELLEDALLRQAKHVEGIVVLTVPVARAAGDVRAVGVCRAWNGRKPAVKEHKVLGHGVEDGDVRWRVVVDDLGGARLVDGRKGDGLLCHEAAHRLVHPVVGGCDGGLVGVVGAEQLHVDAADAVVGIIVGHVGSQRASTDISH